MIAAGVVVTAPSVTAAPGPEYGPGPEYVVANSANCFTIPGPASPGDLAVLNVIVTGALHDGYTTARAFGTAPTFGLPEAERSSTGNFLGHPTDQQLRSVDPNMAVVKIGRLPDPQPGQPAGAVCVDLVSDGAAPGTPIANLIVDYIGFMPADGGARGLARPTRLTDTRAKGSPVAVDTVHWMDTIDAEQGDAVLVNAVVPWANAAGYALVLGEDDTPNADSTTARSTLNYDINTTPVNVNANPNTGMAVVGKDRQMGVEPFNTEDTPVDVVVDELAVIDADSVLDVEPTRVYDARRDGVNQNPVGTQRCFEIPGLKAGDTAVVNLTVDTRAVYTGVDSSGWIYIRPSDSETGNVAQLSSANFEPYNARPNIDPNTTLVMIGTDGKVCVDGFNNSGTKIFYIVDLLGGLKPGTFVDADSECCTNGRERLVDTREGLRFPDLTPPGPAS